ncbi:hypothetical protein K0M31_001554 [Melipona bicolor]|uniref:Uncharacterized protein n=1 Tax=Melipona bicolor TaxID=60889 RepID=A0AA40GFR0_9HYME|nr:hypothetical protein K0M31_001554 [Melipona bicolor]
MPERMPGATGSAYALNRTDVLKVSKLDEIIRRSFCTLINYEVGEVRLFGHEATVNEQQLILVYVNRPRPYHNTVRRSLALNFPGEPGEGQNVVSQFQYLYGHGFPLTTRQQQTPNSQCSAQSLIS